MLELNHISKTFNPGTVYEKKALDRVDLKLEDGDFATIIGSNGAGKSTTFNAITGAFLVDEGSIILDGKDITFTKEHIRSKVIGHLFQDPLLGTAPHMTIEENMALAYLRAGTKNTAFFSRISKEIPGTACLIGHGTGKQDEAAGWSVVRWSETGFNTFNGYDGHSQDLIVG